MRKFRVFVNGVNFLIRLDGESVRHGFYTTRFVEANDAEDAENHAMDLIRDELKSMVLNDSSDSPMMYAEEIDEIEDFGYRLVPGRGFSWYEEDEDKREEKESLDSDNEEGGYILRRRGDGFHTVRYPRLYDAITTIPYCFRIALVFLRRCSHTISNAIREHCPPSDK